MAEKARASKIKEEANVLEGAPFEGGAPRTSATLHQEVDQRRLRQDAAAWERREGIDHDLTAERERHQSQLEEYKKAIGTENERHRRKVEALEKQLAELDHAGDGDEESAHADLFEHGGRVKDVSWNMGSMVAASIVLLCCCLCQGGCVVGACCGTAQGFIYEAAFCLNPSYLFYAPLDSEDDRGRTLRREARLMALLPLLALAGASETTCEGGAPSWLYVIYVPILVRAKIIEWRILTELKQSIISLGFVLGMLDHMDYFTDGVFPIQAYKCEPEATNLFVFSFKQSWASCLAPMISTLHFSGAALILLSAAVFSQQVIAVTGDTFLDKSVAADVPGFGGVAAYYDSRAGSKTGFAVLVITVVKVLVENCMQLWLQASYFALVFDRTTASAKMKLVASMGLGLASASYKAFGTAKIILDQRDLIPVFRVILFLFPLSIFAMLGWTSTKIFFAYTCESHLWNLSSGCVPVL